MHQLVSKETEITSTFSRTSLMEVVLREAFGILRGLWIFPTHKCCNPCCLAPGPESKASTPGGSVRELPLQVAAWGPVTETFSPCGGLTAEHRPPKACCYDSRSTQEKPRNQKYFMIHTQSGIPALPRKSEYHQETDKYFSPYSSQNRNHRAGWRQLTKESPQGESVSRGGRTDALCRYSRSNRKNHLSPHQ